MQAIQTKYIGATNFRGSRIKATCERGSITIPFDSQLNEEEAHKNAVAALVRGFAREDVAKYKTPLDKNPWLRPMACGGLADGSYVHVFIEQGSGPVAIRNAASAFLNQQTVSNRRALRLALNVK